MSIDSNKKKIRGWKKQVRKIDQWFELVKKPDFDHFESRLEDYVKIRIDPWNRLSERTPPMWYSKLILKRLIDIYDLWDKEFQKLNKPYDLQLWINEPNFIKSQVVCAQVDKDGDQRNNYYRIVEHQADFPTNKWQSELFDLNQFTFQLYKDENLSFKNLEDLEEDEIADLIKEGYEAEETIIGGQTDIMYSKKVGNVWVGRKNKSAANIP
ncbi:hypothetical protein [Fulvivirga sp.]|uniref:hypothetical protein n=1 Tax=Fulvivirga sp. TaxID=1931237 RepID=UPI0032ED1520